MKQKIQIRRDDFFLYSWRLEITFLWNLLALVKQNSSDENFFKLKQAFIFFERYVYIGPDDRFEALEKIDEFLDELKTFPAANVFNSRLHRKVISIQYDWEGRVKQMEVCFDQLSSEGSILKVSKKLDQLEGFLDKFIYEMPSFREVPSLIKRLETLRDKMRKDSRFSVRYFSYCFDKIILYLK